MGKTTIEWTATQNTDGSWTPGCTHNHWIGCTHVSPGCTNCYAETMMDKRYGRVRWGKGKPRMLTSAANRRKPLLWNKACAVDGTRMRVFCASLSDWLDEEVPIEWLADLLGLIERTPHLDWLLLSKRIERWGERLHQMVRETHDGVDMFASRWLDGDAPANVWVGTSVEDQRRADERIPHLLEVPARVRFLSCEPLLGPIDLSRWLGLVTNKHGTLAKYRPDLHWLIVGGESGHGARPMHPDWARSLRDQCQTAEIAYFFKQWGEYMPAEDLPDDIGGHGLVFLKPDGQPMTRVGKHAAGRLLDGREWSEYPDYD